MATPCAGERSESTNRGWNGKGLPDRRDFVVFPASLLLGSYAAIASRATSGARAVRETSALPRTHGMQSLDSLSKTQAEQRNNMKLQTIAKLFEDQIKDIYSAETQLLKALP